MQSLTRVLVVLGVTAIMEWQATGRSHVPRGSESPFRQEFASTWNARLQKRDAYDSCATCTNRHCMLQEDVGADRTHGATSRPCARHLKISNNVTSSVDAPPLSGGVQPCSRSNWGSVTMSSGSPETAPAAPGRFRGFFFARTLDSAYREALRTLSRCWPQTGPSIETRGLAYK